MKNRFFKSFAAFCLALALCLCLTGCDQQTYRKAVTLYNNEDFDAAATLFSELDGYEDSGDLQTLSRYWEAITLMENGSYSLALPRFIKLGDYEDSAARAVECTYQMAIAAFESGDYKTAEGHFLEQPQYRKASEYLRQITWQKFFDTVSTAGNKSDGGMTLEKAFDNTILRITTTDAGQLTFSVSTVKNMGYVFYDDLTLTLTRDSLEADFTAASSFDMTLVSEQIGSVQTASGKVSISTCTGDTRLAVDTFQMTVTDNLGRVSTSNDPADCLMDDAMSENLSFLLQQVPQLLTESGIELTLQDIGFASVT